MRLLLDDYTRATAYDASYAPLAADPTSDPAMSAKVNGDWELQSVKRSREKTLSQTFLAFFFFLQASSRRFVSSFRTFSRAVTAP